MQVTEAMLQEQIQLEEEMITTGSERFLRHVQEAHDADRGADTAYAVRLMQEYLDPVAAFLKDELSKSGPGPGNKVHPLIRGVSPYVLGLIGLRCVMNTYTKATKLTVLCIKIGESVEDDIKFKQFKELNPQYFQSILDDFKRKGSFGYSMRSTIFNRHADRLGVQVPSWTTEERLLVGAKIMDALTECTDLVLKEKIWGKRGWVYIISPTQEALDWIQKFNSNAAFLHPERGPCVVPPVPWVLYNKGGFVTAGMQFRTPMVKTKNPLAIQRLSNPSSTVLNALNALQNTVWEINQDVLNVLREVWNKGLEIGIPRSTPYPFPPSPVPRELKTSDMSAEQLTAFKQWKFVTTQLHSDNKERTAKCFEVIRCMQTASKYLGKPLWFVYQCDFRGRMYPSTSSISSQGGDFNKALLRFHEGKEITAEGVPWFKIHGANTYGIDKLSFTDRIKWVDEHADIITKFAQDPINHLDFWKEADKPYQFYAWAREFLGFIEQGPSFISHISMGLDGTCNGLQNFSAMLRDPVGGLATNLINQDKPSDIYAEVAKVLSKKVLEQTDEKFNTWKLYLTACNGQFPRGLTKRPVMTMPYGVTMHSCRDYLAQYLASEVPDVFPRAQVFNQATVLVPLLWASMGEVVKAARLGMDWIQEAASLTAKSEQALAWWSPAGFPVVQDCRKTTIKQIKTQVSGKIRLAIRFDEAIQDAKKQTQAAAPNFIHSMDAAHAMLTIQAGIHAGITAFHFVHDDFGTHVHDIPKLFKLIREQFVFMYSTCTPLEEFKSTVELDTGVKLTPPPVPGTLDITQVLDSMYFFS